MKKKEIIILGAGITGLVTAWKLAKSGYKVTVIEKEKYPGGLAGTVDWDGWKFDFGTHNFSSKNHKEIIEFYKELLPGEFIPRELNAKLFIFGKLINLDYIGAHFFYMLSLPNMIKAGIDFFLTRLRAFLFGIKYTERLDVWIKQRFGKVLYGIYFGPYIERIQKKNPSELSKDVGDKKIPVFCLRDYIKRELTFKKKEKIQEVIKNNMFYIKNGYGELSKFFFNELSNMNNAEVYLGSEIKSIGYDGKKVKSINLEDRKIDASEKNVLSTIPVDVLANLIDNIPSEVKESAEKFEYTKLRVLFVRTKLEKISGFSQISVEAKYPFSRVSESNYDEFNLVPEGHSSLTIELPLNDTDELWKISNEELLEKILPQYNDICELKKEDIIDCRTVYLHYANPRMIINYKEILKSVFGFIYNTGNLYSIGRQGLFTYINADGCTRMALDLADAIIDDKSLKDFQKKLMFDFHEIEL
ncbi:MAG: FAD-dependent oxidoreductase [Ignavibacteriae bacterium]|nr:FAD-dependent oxidoreductase [Ignavibacteriota bacterium]